MIKDLIRINYAKTALPESMIFSLGSDEKRIPIVFSCFLILTENKKILVDAGCDTMSDFFVMRDFIGPVAALKEKGFSADEITDIIITHAHHDHIDGVRHFKNAVVHIQNEEYEREGKCYITDDSKVKMFEDETTVDGVKAVKIGGHSDGSCVAEFEFEGKKCVICGDECYTRYNIENFIPTATSCNPQKSKEFLEKYCTGDYVCHLCHEE